MKLNLNKKKLKNLSQDSNLLPTDMTPRVAGGLTATTCGGPGETAGECHYPEFTGGPCNTRENCIE